MSKVVRSIEPDATHNEQQYLESSTLPMDLGENITNDNDNIHGTFSFYEGMQACTEKYHQPLTETSNEPKTSAIPANRTMEIVSQYAPAPGQAPLMPTVAPSPSPLSSTTTATGFSPDQYKTMPNAADEQAIVTCTIIGGETATSQVLTDYQDHLQQQEQSLPLVSPPPFSLVAISPMTTTPVASPDLQHQQISQVNPSSDVTLVPDVSSHAVSDEVRPTKNLSQHGPSATAPAASSNIVEDAVTSSPIISDTDPDAYEPDHVSISSGDSARSNHSAVTATSNDAQVRKKQVTSSHILTRSAAAAAAEEERKKKRKKKQVGVARSYKGSRKGRRGINKRSSGESVRKKSGLVAKVLEPAPGQTRYWTQEEHEKFLTATAKYGEKAYVAISNYVETRTPKQVRTHAQKYQMKMARLAKQKAEAEAQKLQHKTLSEVAMNEPLAPDVPQQQEMKMPDLSFGQATSPLAFDNPSVFVDPYVSYIGNSMEFKDGDLDAELAAQLHISKNKGFERKSDDVADILASEENKNKSQFDDLRGLEGHSDLDLEPFKDPCESWLQPDAENLPGNTDKDML